MHCPHRATLSLSALFKPRAEGRKRMTDNLCPICSYNTWAQTSEKCIGLKPQKRTHLGKKQGWGPVLNMPVTVLDKPPGQILLGGPSSVEHWEDLSGLLTTSAALIQPAHVSKESVCHGFKSKASWQWHVGLFHLVFHFNLEKFWGSTLGALRFLLCRAADFPVQATVLFV